MYFPVREAVRWSWRLEHVVQPVGARLLLPGGRCEPRAAGGPLGSRGGRTHGSLLEVQVIKVH